MDLETGTYEPGFVGIRFCQEWWVIKLQTQMFEKQIKLAN